MKKALLHVTILEATYLTLSLIIAQLYGQWSYEGEIIRTGLRVIPIVFYGYYYQKYFYNENNLFKTKKYLTPQFVAAIALFMLFGIVYSNAENETVLWQFVFAISGIAAGLREELFYRGILQNTLQIKYDEKVALSFATLIFVFSHVQYIYCGQVTGLLFITFAGVIFGCVFMYTGNIVFTAIIHSLYDALLSVSLIPYRLDNGIALLILCLIMFVFLMIAHNNKYMNRPGFVGGSII